MKTATPLPRNLILSAGAVTAMGCGAIYMWSIFNKPLMDAYGFSTSEVSMAYSLFLLMSCFSSMIAGWLQQKMQPRFIVMGAGIMFGVGWFGAGFADNLPLLFLFFSGFAGAGNGFLYNTIVAVVTKWFPDKRGFANGICIGAMGIGPMLFAPLGNLLIESFNVQTAFQIVGIAWLVIYAGLSWMLYVPKPGWFPTTKRVREIEAEEVVAENTDAPSNNVEELEGREINITTRQMFKRPLYYVLFLIMMVSSTSGLMVTGHASNIGQELASLTATEGAIMVSVMAFGSFMGRFGFGFLSDFIGRYNALIIALAINSVIMLLVLQFANSFIAFLIAITLVGACFGAAMSIVPAMVGDAFGSINFGQNYSFVYPGYTVASFIGPMAAATAVEMMGSYVPSFFVAGVISLVGIALVFFGKRLDVKNREELLAEQQI